MKLAFEYQGVQHYKDTLMLGEVSERQFKDQQKRNECERLGISLIEIPFWWDRRKESLIEFIKQQRPELVQSNSQNTTK